MSEPRTRTAAEVADHAAALVDYTQGIIDDAWTVRDCAVANVLNRLAAQVEDLAAEVDRLRQGCEPGCTAHGRNN